MTKTIQTVKTTNNLVCFEKWIKTCFAVLLVVFLAFSFFTVVFADGEGGEKTVSERIYENYVSELDSIDNMNTQAPASLVKAAYTIQFITSPNFLLTLTGVDSEIVKWSDYAQPLKSGYDIFAVLGNALVILYALVELMNKIQLEQLSPEIIVKWVLQLIAGIVIIMKGFDMFGFLLSIGGNALQQVAALNLFEKEITEKALAPASEFVVWGVLKLLCMIIEGAISLIFTIIALIYIYATLLGRAIEIMVRVVFSPIAIADVSSHGLHSPGWNYIKKFLGLCLQSSVLLLIIKAAGLLNSVVSSIQLVPVLSGINTILVMITMLGLMIKSQQIVSDITGAH